MPGYLNDAMQISSKCLEAVVAWMGHNRLLLNSRKTKGLWVFGPPGSRNLPSLVLDGMVLPQTDWMSGARLDSQVLIKEQLAATARRAFPQFRDVHQSLMSL